MVLIINTNWYVKKDETNNECHLREENLPFADLAGPLQTVLNSFFIMDEITRIASVGYA